MFSLPVLTQSAGNPQRVGSFSCDLPLIETARGLNYARDLAAALRSMDFANLDTEMRTDHLLSPHPHHWKSLALSIEMNLDRLPPEKAIRYDLFKMGGNRSRADLAAALDPFTRDLVRRGTDLGLFIEAEGKTAMQGLTCIACRLVPDDVIYCLTDLPSQAELPGRRRAYLSVDSYEMIIALLGRGPVTRPVLEIGSGPALQSIALLKANPDCPLAIAVECDARARNLARFNAAMNGVSDRLLVIENSDGVEDLLRGQPLSLVFGNPPHFAVPERIDVGGGRTIDGDALFSAVGHGGRDGVSVTRELVGPIRHLFAPDASLLINGLFGGNNAVPETLKGLAEALRLHDVVFRPSFDRYTPRTRPLREHVGGMVELASEMAGRDFPLTEGELWCVFEDVLRYNARIIPGGYYHEGFAELRPMARKEASVSVGPPLIDADRYDLPALCYYLPGPLIPRR